MGHHSEKFIFDAVRCLQLHRLIAGLFIESRVIDGHGRRIDEGIYKADLLGTKLMFMSCVEGKDSQ